MTRLDELNFKLKITNETLDMLEAELADTNLTSFTFNPKISELTARIAETKKTKEEVLNELKTLEDK